MRSTLVFALVFGGIFSLAAQSKNFWNDLSETQITQNTPRLIIPAAYRTLHLDFEKMKNHLDAAPSVERIISQETEGLELWLPLPDGSGEQFHVWDAPVLHPDLAKKYPGIRSFSGKSLRNDGTTVRFDYGPNGFHAMILSPSLGSIFIDPYAQGNVNEYTAYTRADFYKTNTKTMSCSVEGFSSDSLLGHEAVNDRASDCGILHTYRLALACTGEYANFQGGNSGNGNKAIVLAAMNTSMTRINGVYEKEISVHMTIVANNDQIIYLNGATDPFTNDDGGLMLDENQTTCDGVIGSANYDIGHVFSTGGGGVAYLNAPCSSYKAGGVTGSSSPIGDPFDIDYVAHEMGHQFGGNHTFYSTQGSCNGNQENTRAFEPGSGSTIMAYAGICGPTNNVQNNSDAYFHTGSLLEMGVFILTNTCDVESATGNHAPSITSISNATIPTSTPFRLLTTASDTDGDAITYNWEQYNPHTTGSNATMPPAATNTKGPLFRSWFATTTNERYFPKLADVVANNSPTWEKLASVNRTLYFRLTVRDNNPLGGCTTQFPAASTGVNASATSCISLTTSTTGAPFTVSYPNATGISWPQNSSQTVTWTAVGTATTVDILLSTDGGYTYPTVLATATPNDGTQTITVPLATPLVSTARIMVRSVGNYYYDISNNNFTITQALPLELTGFQAKRVSKNAAELRWATASESDLRGFRIERSLSDATHFEPIGFVESSGHASAEQAYFFKDENLPLSKIAFYRLFAEDLAGPSYGKFSPICSVLPIESSASGLTIEPNLVSSRARLKTVENEPLDIEIFDFQGILVKKVDLETEAELDFSDLEAGVFTVVARSERQFWTARFLKI